MAVSARTCFLCGTAHFTTQPCPARKVVAPALPAGVTKGVPTARTLEKAGRKPRQKITEKITAPVVGPAADGGVVAVLSLEDWRERALAAEAELERIRKVNRDRVSRQRKRAGSDHA